MNCTACGGQLVSLGVLGNLHWFRCRDCGIDQHADVDDIDGEGENDLINDLNLVDE